MVFDNTQIIKKKDGSIWTITSVDVLNNRVHVRLGKTTEKTTYSISEQFLSTFEIEDEDLVSEFKRLSEEYELKNQEKARIQEINMAGINYIPVVKTYNQFKNKPSKESSNKSKVEKYDLNTNFNGVVRAMRKAIYDLEAMGTEGESFVDLWRNYNNPKRRAAYIMKYIYAYSYEYLLMYIDMIQNDDFDKSLSVLSLGCGAMIDAWSLQEAAEYCFSKLNIRYTGIDLEEKWENDYFPNTQPILKKNGRMGITAGDYLQGLDVCDYDIIMFPKSLADIVFSEPWEDFDKIVNALDKMQIEKDVIYLAFSFVQNERKEIIDKAKEIVKVIEAKGFKSDDPSITRNCSSFVDYEYAKVVFPRLEEVYKDKVHRLINEKPMRSRSYEHNMIYRLIRVK